jgi:hypothetical protein
MEHVMGICSPTGLKFTQPREPNDITNSECEKDPTAVGRVLPEANDFASDAFWIAMMRQDERAAVCPKSIWRAFYGVDKSDQRRNEVAEADRKSFVQSLKKSYGRRADTVVWSMIVFILAAIVLIPLLGFPIGPTFSALVSLCWTVLHRVRRL